MKRFVQQIKIFDPDDYSSKEALEKAVNNHMKEKPFTVLNMTSGYIVVQENVEMDSEDEFVTYRKEVWKDCQKEPPQDSTVGTYWCKTYSNIHALFLYSKKEGWRELHPIPNSKVKMNPKIWTELPQFTKQFENGE